ncbi:MAG: DUF1461 domain-containing protein [Candidatus Aenigmarchaeota archaeon]|nr:DUF1461 domain-containing protein [Candidatus Aenigmarchaeota archaeon]
MKFIVAFVMSLMVLSINLNIICYEPFFIMLNDSENALVVLRYVKGEYVDVSFLSENEIAHLNDVKIMLFFSNLFLKIAFMFLIFLAIFKWHLTLDAAKIGSFMMIGFSFFTLIYSLFFFDNFFTNFHKIFFPNGNWSFDPSSTLIQLFPLDFWYKTSFIFISINIFDGFVLFFLYYFLKKTKSASK